MNETTTKNSRNSWLYNNNVYLCSENLGNEIYPAMNLQKSPGTFFRHMLLLLSFFATLAVQADRYPANCRVTTTLNVRSGPGTGYSKVGKLYRGNTIVVNSVTFNSSRQWGEIDYYGQTGYVATQYVTYLSPVEQEPAPRPQYAHSHSSSSFDGLWGALKVIFWILLVILCLSFLSEIIEFLLTAAFLAAIGAVIFWLFGGRASTGANIGVAIAVIIRLKLIVDFFSPGHTAIFEFIYNLVSFPFWFLNRLQLILMEPWRYLTKGYLPDGVRSFFRPILYPIELLLYILITPLRLVNAFYFNIVVYGITELFDLFLETLAPSKNSEGRGNLFMWIIWFPVRLVKYPVLRGCLVLIEGAIWTVIDIFIPTVTLYHGTDLTAAQCIVGNDWEKGKNKKWTDGTFCSSTNGWAGAGAYFGSARRTAKGYAYDPYRLGSDIPVMIVCRVSLGKILNYGLAAPRYIHNNAGDGGNHALITSYAKEHGYTTGEWWNPRGYWEYCLFDWQNAYNNPWRIRPIYVFNFDTGMAQHINGGFRHWLFSEMVLRDILKSPRFICLLVFAVIVVIWFVFYGWNYLWNEHLWYYYIN